MATTLETISKNAEVHAQARNLLAERVTALTDAQAASAASIAQEKP